jgi:hypothetical protein
LGKPIHKVYLFYKTPIWLIIDDLPSWHQHPGFVAQACEFAFLLTRILPASADGKQEVAIRRTDGRCRPAHLLLEGHMRSRVRRQASISNIGIIETIDAKDHTKKSAVRVMVVRDRGAAKE